MTVQCDAEFVRQIVLRVFAQAGRQADGADGVAEMILINDGKYRGRSYRSEGLLAMWLVDMGVLQVYGRDGQMLRTINLFEELGGLRRAA